MRLIGDLEIEPRLIGPHVVEIPCVHRQRALDQTMFLAPAPGMRLDIGHRPFRMGQHGRHPLIVSRRLPCEKQGFHPPILDICLYGHSHIFGPVLPIHVAADEVVKRTIAELSLGEVSHGTGHVRIEIACPAQHVRVIANPERGTVWTTVPVHNLPINAVVDGVLRKK